MPSVDGVYDWEVDGGAFDGPVAKARRVVAACQSEGPPASLCVGSENPLGCSIREHQIARALLTVVTDIAAFVRAAEDQDGFGEALAAAIERGDWRKPCG